MKPRWIDDDVDFLLKSMLKLRDRDEILDYFYDIMSVKEIKNLAMRIKIARLLGENCSYKEIERSTGISSATIAKMSKNLNYGSGGLIKVINRMSRKR